MAGPAVSFCRLVRLLKTNLTMSSVKDDALCPRPVLAGVTTLVSEVEPRSRIL